nr:A24 family peptidase [Sinobacterium caligoides]
MTAIAVVLIISLLVGSFLNVVIYRLPLMMYRDWKQQVEEFDESELPKLPTAERFNLATPNSSCPHCGHKIRPWENIPVVSYLLQRGRCSSCQQPISLRYPLVEAVTALLSALVIYQLGFTIAGLVAVAFTWVLVALTLIDADHKLLPDSLTLPLLWAALIANYFGLFADFGDAFWGAIAGYLALWSVYWLFKLLTGKEGMGYGDFKLLAFLGAWMGWQALPLILILSAGVGAILGVAMIVLSKRDSQTTIPFGPYLACAGYIALLWGDTITQHYLQFAGLN